MMTKEPQRCHWCNLRNPLYVDYHDHEWGVPEHDDHHLFELLLLECFQAGLSWECVLNKREAFRRAFAGFDPVAVSQFDQTRQEQLAQDATIIRNRLKIKAAVTNAQVFLRIQAEYGTFATYLWGFTNGHTLYETGLATSPLSDLVSRDLYRRGMRFVGSTIVYSYLQAAGIINSHEPGCFLHAKFISANSVSPSEKP